MDAALDSVEGDWEVGWVWGEDCDCGAAGESVDGCLVGIWVCCVV